MAEERVQRRLAAILAADVVGYSGLMEKDETGTLARLRSLRSEIFDPRTKQFHGRIFKNTGDGAFAEFGSAVDAVQCAVEIQRALAERNADLPQESRVILRIGISLGDVIVEGDDLYGNGVNVAARMEGLAKPGGICISANVHDHVGHILDVALEDLGEQTVKNIERPVRCYRVLLQSGGIPETQLSASLWEKPAIAVLPFENMSGDPEQEYFADGLTEDIITALLRWRSFPVIARNSTFAYKGQSPDIREVGKALNARYVVEGSVRKAGNRARITAQLINTATGHHIWAERYDRQIDDIFALQDEITARIAAIIEPAIAGAEHKQLATRPPRELSAWDLCIQGQYLIYESTRDSNRRAREKFEQAIEIDPDYARAWCGLAYTHMHDLRLGYAGSREESGKRALDAARRAVQLDDSDADAHTFLGRALHGVFGQTENALEALRHALSLNPQNTTAIMSMGIINAFKKDEPEEGIRWLEKALEINPLDPRGFIIKTHLAMANICAGNYERAAELARDAIRQRADYLESRAALASALGYLNRTLDAAQALGEFRDRVFEYTESYPLWDETTKNKVLTGLRKAGLIE